MKNMLFALLAAAGVLAGPSIVHAEGAYVGAGVAASRFNFNVPNAVSNDDHSGYEAAGKLFAGYEFDKNFGIEGAYTNFGNNDYSYTQGGVNGRIETNAHAFYVAGKASAPVNEQVSVFGKLGAARIHDGASGSGAAAGLGGSDSKTGLYASLGAQYALSQNVALTAELEHYGTSADFGRKSTAVTFGARYHF